MKTDNNKIKKIQVQEKFKLTAIKLRKEVMTYLKISKIIGVCTATI